MTLDGCGCPDRPMTWCAECVGQQDKTIQGLAKLVIEQRRQMGVMALICVIYTWQREIRTGTLTRWVDRISKTR